CVGYPISCISIGYPVSCNFSQHPSQFTTESPWYIFLKEAQGARYWRGSKPVQVCSLKVSSVL
ncbi:hypothetical protein K0M31_002670, partial [Melipona bicolor]